MGTAHLDDDCSLGWELLTWMTTAHLDGNCSLGWGMLTWMRTAHLDGECSLCQCKKLAPIFGTEIIPTRNV